MPLGPAKVCPRAGAPLVTGSALPGAERGRAASSVAAPCEPQRLTLMSVLTGRCTRSAVRIRHRDMPLLCSPCGVNNRSCRKLKAPTSTSATNIGHIWRDQNDPPRYRFSVWWMETSAGQSIPNLSPQLSWFKIYRSTQVTLSEARHFNHSEHQLQRLVCVCEHRGRCCPWPCAQSARVSISISSFSSGGTMLFVACMKDKNRNKKEQILFS